MKTRHVVMLYVESLYDCDSVSGQNDDTDSGETKI